MPWRQDLMEAENAVEKLKKNGKPVPKELVLQLYNYRKQRDRELKWRPY